MTNVLTREVYGQYNVTYVLVHEVYAQYVTYVLTHEVCTI
jgi:hypothetical protein